MESRGGSEVLRLPQAIEEVFAAPMECGNDKVFHGAGVVEHQLLTDCRP